MKTKNKRLLDPAQNQEYYSKSDGNYMDIKMATKAHLMLDRIKWGREWIHKVGSQYHLDFGCKDGYFDLTLASEGIECVGVDPSKDAIEEANLRAKELDLDNARFIVGTIEDYIPKFDFDTVSMLEVLEHVVDPEKVIKKLLQCGSLVLISTPDAEGRHGMHDSEQNEEHVRLYTKDELDNLIQSLGGKIEESVKRDDQLCIAFRSLI